jgi:hypothetical protein
MLGIGATPRVRYGDAPQAYKEPAQAEACAAWLVEVLEEAGEPMRPKEVVALGGGGQRAHRGPSGLAPLHFYISAFRPFMIPCWEGCAD